MWHGGGQLHVSTFDPRPIQLSCFNEQLLAMLGYTASTPLGRVHFFALGNFWNLATSKTVYL